MRFDVVAADQKDRFNAFVSSSDAGDVLQSYEWGEAKRSTSWEPHRVQVTEDDSIIAACSILTTRPTRLFPGIAYSPRGPIWSSTQALSLLIQGIKEQLNDEFAFICDPAIAVSDDLEKLGFVPVASGGFGGIQPKAVMEIHLEGRSSEELLAGFKQKWRYNVRLSQKKGVAVREGTSEDLGTFYELLTETSKRDGFPIRSKAYYQAVWTSLEPGGLIKMFVAENSGKAIAAVVMGTFAGRATYLYGASSNSDRNLMPNHLLHWEAIKWANEAGFKTYDLQGVSPMRDGKPTDDSASGLNRFKEGFGSTYVEYVGELDLPLRPNWYRAWRSIYPQAAKILRRIRTV